MKTQLANWAIHKIESEYKDDVCLLIGHKVREFDENNDEIRQKFLQKVSIERLADEYCLSEETVRKIIFK